MTILLVIEPHTFDPNSMSPQLEKAGFTVFTTPCFEESTEILQTYQPDLILCRHDQAHFDGFQCLKKASLYSHSQSLPKLLISEQSDRVTFRKAMALGADDFLPAPYTMEEIVEAIEHQLQRSCSLKQHYVEHHQTNSQAVTLSNLSQLNQHFSQLKHETQDLETQTQLYVIGIDQLNWFRSTSGSQFSNTVIEYFSRRLVESQENLQQSCLVANIDEQLFALLPFAGEEQSIRQILDQSWHQHLSQPLIIQGQEISMTTSIAAIDFKIHSNHSLDSIVNQARRVLKRINKQGGNQFQHEAFQAQSQSSDQFAIATNLLKGLTDDEFHAYYQPQVDLKTGKFIGVEALVRWHHHEWGVLEPGRFIPVAEETAMIMQIDERVLRLACQAIQRWHESCFTPLNVSVNLSALSFNRPNLGEIVHSILTEYNVSPEWIELEITESMLVQDTKKAAQIMQELKAIGVSIALDDFGVGYSSLNYLQQFPLDTLKIDQSFVQKVDSNRGNAAITEAVIKLAHSLNLKVIAEGVERVAEREFLKNLNCDVMQGYLISPPVPKSVFETFLASQNESRCVAA